jgi:hypothetical protein
VAVRLEDYIPVEEGVAKWLYGLWSDAASPLLPKLGALIEAGEYDDAWRLVNSIDVQSIAHGAAKGLENHAVTALTFGAMLAAQSDKVMYIDHPLPTIIPNVVKMYQAVFPRIQKTILTMLVSFFQTHEPVAKDDCGCMGDIATLLMKGDKLSLGQKLNAVVMGQARGAIDVAANLNTSRLVQLGYLQQSTVSGVSTYQITEVMDGRTCGVCRSMHGQTFNVQSGIDRLLTILQMTDPDAVKQAAPFPSQSADNVAALKSMSQMQLEQAGMQTPPYHPGCRGMTVPVGTVTTVSTEVVPSVEQFESVFSGGGATAATVNAKEFSAAGDIEKDFSKWAEKHYTSEVFHDDNVKWALAHYTGSAYGPMNEWLRGAVPDDMLSLGYFEMKNGQITGSEIIRNGKDAVPVIKRMVAEMDKAAAESKITAPVRVYRGFGGLLESAGVKDFSELVGKEFSDDGFMSFSANIDIADFFGNVKDGVILDFTVPADTNMIVPWRHSRGGVGEVEFIMPRGSRFKVVSVDTSDNTPVVSVELLPGVVTKSESKQAKKKTKKRPSSRFKGVGSDLIWQ